MAQIGLVLEGGGMRGVYTAGVLDFFMEKELYFPYVIGVSAGACHAASYISRQIGRNKAVNIGFIRDPRYLSYRNLIKTKSLFGMDFIFDEIPNKLVPFDYETFYKSPQKYVIGTTDCVTGEPVYWNKEDCDHELILKILMASSSLPFISPVAKINGFNLLDGGISDPIPIRKSISDGNSRNVIILTRNKGYRKKPFKYKWLLAGVYREFAGLVKAMLERHKVYNMTLDFIEQLEREGKALVIRPSETLTVDRFERNPEKLTNLYQLGYKDAQNFYNKIVGEGGGIF